MDQPKPDHFHLLCDVGDLINGLETSADTAAFLQRITHIIAQRLHADACLIYLCDDACQELVLRARHSSAVPVEDDPQRCQVGKGIIGTAFSRGYSVTDADPIDPEESRLPATADQWYRSFTAVPITRGAEKVGVVLIRRARPGGFSEGARRALRATALQLAGIIANARLLQAVGDKAARPRADTPGQHAVLVGQAVSHGVAVGPAGLRGSGRLTRLRSLPAFERHYTIRDLDVAIERTAHELEALQTRIGERLTEATALIFDAHLMILKDSTLVESVHDEVAAGKTASRAFLDVCRGYMDLFSNSAHFYTKEKARDVEDVACRVLGNLIGAASVDGVAHAKRVVVTDELFPSDMLVFASGDVAGIVTSSGGATAHVAILGRALGIPMVILDAADLLTIPENATVALDGESGVVHVNPPPAMVDSILTHAESVHASVRSRVFDDDGEARTADGVRIQVLANINLLAEISLAIRAGADGIGLYRSELLFLIRTSLPSEQEQFDVYSKLLESMPRKAITIRTLDVGADKLLPYFDAGSEENPALGLRSLRFCARHPEVFRKQLRAILRAGAGRESLRILLPMVCAPAEVDWVRGVIRECIASLQTDGLPHHTAPLIGAMIEVPAAVEVIDELAAAADFLALGTNDLTQYMLAVDRGNALVSEHFRPDHPAVLRAVKRVVEAARRHGRPLSVCGEMASRQPYLSFLIGLGVESLSVAPQHIPRVRETLRRLSFGEARGLAEEATRTGVLVPGAEDISSPLTAEDKAR